MNELQKKYTQEAIDQLESGEYRRRLERKSLVEYLIPIELGILGATIASLSVDMIAQIVLHNPNYGFLFKSGLVLISFSFFVGIWFLFAEKKVFDEDESIKAFKKLDLAEAVGKPNTWFLAQAELTNRRSVPVNKISTEYSVILKDALDLHKNELKSWKWVSNPEKLYSTESKEVLETLLSSSLFFGALGVGILILMFVFII